MVEEQALVVTRFDRGAGGEKLRLADCARKYNSAYEDIALIIKQHRLHQKTWHHRSQKCTRYAMIRRATWPQIICRGILSALTTNNRIFNLINQLVSRWIFMPRLRPTFLATLNDAPGYLVAWTR